MLGGLPRHRPHIAHGGRPGSQQRGRLPRGRLSQLQAPGGDRTQRLEQFQHIMLVSRYAGTCRPSECYCLCWWHAAGLHTGFMRRSTVQHMGTQCPTFLQLDAGELMGRLMSYKARPPA